MSKNSLVDDNHQFHKEAGFWWNRNYISVASITLSSDGTLIFSGNNYNLEIHNIGTDKEKIVVKNCADLVL